MRKPQPDRTPAFSLVELLAVMAIISILAGMILPALGRALATARSTVCAGNLRQLGLMHLSYTQENAGWVISPYADNAVGSWINFFCRDFCDNSEEVFHCPGIPDNAWFAPPGGQGDYDLPIGATYLMNACGNGASKWSGSSISDKNISFGWTQGFVGTAKYALPVRYRYVRQPTARILLVESSWGFANLIAPTRASAGRYVDRYAQTDHGVPITSTSYAAYRNVGDHHLGGFNALMGGFSVRAMRVSDDWEWVAYVK